MNREVIEGTSGAQVHLGSSVAVKIWPPSNGDQDGRRRVLDQGRFMMDQVPLVTRCFPRVHCVFDGGYVMERLSPMREVPPPSVFTSMRRALASLWVKRELVSGGSALGHAHERYLRRLCDADQRPDVFHAMMSRLEDVRALDVTLVQQTHGDPTLENTMLNGWGGVCFVDPIPPTDRVPSLLAVDLGKMLQSARGYERMRRALEPQYDTQPYCDTAAGYREEAEACIFEGESADDLVASEYMWRLHLLRLVPYQPTPRLRGHFTGVLRDALGL